MSRLKWITAKGEVMPLVPDDQRDPAHILQSMRELDTGLDIEGWADEMLRKDTTFVSYRIADGTPSAFRACQQLMSEGRALFWDRWSLPRRVVESREWAESGPLDEYLFERLRLSSQVVPIESPRYGEAGSYSARELQEATKRGTLQKPFVATGEGPALLLKGT
jgi:hypothetical protein